MGIRTGVAFSATVLLGTLTVLPRNGTHNLALDHLKLSELAPPPLINITRAPPFLLFLSILASRAAGLACEEQEGDEDDDEGNEPFALHAAGHWMCKTPASSSRAAISTAQNWIPFFLREVKKDKEKIKLLPPSLDKLNPGGICDGKCDVRAVCERVCERICGGIRASRGAGSVTSLERLSRFLHTQRRCETKVWQAEKKGREEDEDMRTGRVRIGTDPAWWQGRVGRPGHLAC